MVNRADLIKQLSHPAQVFVLEQIDSTNNYLANQTDSGIQICIANEQTNGRGRFERVWLSGKDTSILCSIKRSFSAKTSLNGLSLVIGLAIINALETHQNIKELQLKWPNDILYQGKKLAGILLENTFTNHQHSVIIGFGLNYQFKPTLTADFDWADLSQITPSLPDKTALSATLINEIMHQCDVFETQGFAAFQPHWQHYDYLYGKTICRGGYSGKAVGINAEGALCLDVGDEIKILYSHD